MMTRPLLLVAFLACSALAEDVAPVETATRAGDPLKVEFVLPFEAALARARVEQKLLFVKPIYGGVDREGAADYRCGSW